MEEGVRFMILGTYTLHWIFFRYCLFRGGNAYWGQNDDINLGNAFAMP